MGLALDKPKLFHYKKGFLLFIFFISLFIVVRLFFTYLEYKEFIAKPFYYTKAYVIIAYKKSKNGREYQVLKLKSDDGYRFYTTTYIKEDLNHKYLRLQIFPNSSISFSDYLGTFYVKSRIKQQWSIGDSKKDILEAYISSQHKSAILSSFYNGIFFAKSIDIGLRHKIALLGVSHLVALSGFHLGILWSLIYGFLLLLYEPFHQKFFPYRFALIDVGAVTMAILGAYLWFVGYPASLLRSYTMMFVGWAVLCMGLELLSFQFLFMVILILVALLPYLLVSIGFWLSVAGVFYIFLLLRYFENSHKLIIAIFIIPFGIFIFMLPIVHTIFGVTSNCQLLSPLLSILFIPFYPLAIILHIFGMGGVLDNVLLWLFNLPKESHDAILPVWATLLYVALSIGAIWEKRLFYVTMGLGTLYGFYIFYIDNHISSISSFLFSRLQNFNP